MKKVYQTMYGEEKGNCFQACVASLLELRLDQVPHFCLEGNEDWHIDFIRWLHRFSLSAVVTKGIESESTQDVLNGPSFKDCYVIVGGKIKTDVHHAVIYRGGELVHNPNNKDGADIKEPEDIIVIFPQNPGRWQ